MKKYRFYCEGQIINRYCAQEKTKIDEDFITMYRVLLRNVHIKMQELENYSEV